MVNQALMGFVSLLCDLGAFAGQNMGRSLTADAALPRSSLRVMGQLPARVSAGVAAKRPQAGRSGAVQRS